MCALINEKFCCHQSADTECEAEDSASFDGNAVSQVTVIGYCECHSYDVESIGCQIIGVNSWTRGIQTNRSETTFSQTRQPGALLETLNPHIDLRDFHSTAEVGHIPFAVNVDMKKFGFRTMYQTLMGASEGIPSPVSSN